MKFYQDKHLFIAFPCSESWYLYNHDELLGLVLSETTIGKTKSWLEEGNYHFPTLSMQLQNLLEPYKIPTGVSGPLEIGAVEKSR